MLTTIYTSAASSHLLCVERIGVYTVISVHDIMLIPESPPLYPLEHFSSYRRWLLGYSFLWASRKKTIVKLPMVLAVVAPRNIGRQISLKSPAIS